MSNNTNNYNSLNERIEALEERLMHLEAALDVVTRTLLEQEKQLSRQAEVIQRLEDQVRGLAGGSMTDPRKEPPPPHY